MFKINHIAIVTKNIEKYIENSLYSQVEKIVVDPVQNSKIAIINTTDSEPNIELIEPLGESATTYNFLKKTGGGLHHICYEANSEKEVNKLLEEKHIKKFFGAVPAIVFNNKKVIFGYSRNREIVEFIINEK